MNSSEQSSGFAKLLKAYNNTSIVLLIVIGMVLGAIGGVVLPNQAVNFTILSNLFVGALKAIAPILVFILVCASVTNHKRGQDIKLKPLLLLYLSGTFAAAIVAVIASFMFPSELILVVDAAKKDAVGSVGAVLTNLISQIVANPIDALANANYLSLIFWAVGFGFTFQHSSEGTKVFISDVALAVSNIVRMIVRFAPFGIFSLVYTTVGTFGIQVLTSYIHVLVVLLGSMFFVAFVVNPLFVFAKLRTNPYPLVWTCIKNSGITAFFTRSSAANIPVNLNLCERLELPRATYAISIPLGATINMAGAAITITVLTLAAANTLGVQVDFASAIFLSILASVCACGASGVAGGSLMLIPLACSLFGISNDIAMQVVGVGFIIGVLQDSTETALNSSTDVLFTATAVLDSSDDLSARVEKANQA